MRLPEFSIIIPCYKQAHLLGEALGSLSSQTFSDWEAIVIDDGSPDNVVEVVENWIWRDNRIRLLCQKNAGLSGARNAGLEASNGRFISFLDADDKYSPYFLESVYKKLIQGVELVACGYTYFNNFNNLFKHVRLSKHLQFKDILTGNLFPVMSLSFNKSLITKVGLFDTALKSAEDWDFWMRFYRVGVSFSVISDSLSFYRISESSMSRQPFTMYESLKKVALRACASDDRLKNSTIDLHVVNNLPYTLRRLLLMCMGVAVMQGKISDAITLILKEKEEYKFELRPVDFKNMCSYLSFRYYYTSDDLIWVEQELMPLFKQFIALLPLAEHDKKNALSHIFYVHKKLINKKKWGFISPLINKFS